MRGVTIDDTKTPADPLISTHTPHARRDAVKSAGFNVEINISTHTPHARRDITTRKPLP